MAETSEDLLRLIPVPRETVAQFEVYADLLVKWQRGQNLVSRSTLEHIWTRHFADSLQLLEYGLANRPWVDLGSGAGFPGLVIALAGQGDHHHVDLIESNRGKCAFLEEVIRATSAPAKVYPARAEACMDKITPGTKTITARALAPLHELCSYIEPLMGDNSIALIPKGRNLSAEIDQAKRIWKMNYEVLQSKTSSEAAILRINRLEKL